MHNSKNLPLISQSKDLKAKAEIEVKAKLESDLSEEAISLTLD
ncbi:hypothetical protein [Coleofasciculus sp. FACHB-129]|nr:hypothetical protein [Coleofasciculus sp. FACHB-129]